MYIHAGSIQNHSGQGGTQQIVDGKYGGLYSGLMPNKLQTRILISNYPKITKKYGYRKYRQMQASYR